MSCLSCGGGGALGFAPADSVVPRLPIGQSDQLNAAILPHGLAVVDEYGVLRVGDGATPGGLRQADSAAIQTQTLGPAPWAGVAPPSPEDPAVQALVGPAIASGAPLLLRPGQTAYIDIGEDGHLPASRLQDAIRFQEAWGGGPAVRIRLLPGQHVMTKGVLSSRCALSWVEGSRGPDGKLWREAAITGLSIAVVGPKNPAAPTALQMTRITATLDSVAGLSVGDMVRLVPTSPGTLAEKELADGCAGAFPIEAINAAARQIAVRGHHYGVTAFPAFPAGGVCRIFHSTLRVSPEFNGGAFVIGTDTEVGPPGRLHLNLALDMSPSLTNSTTAVMVFYGGALTFDPYALAIYGGNRTGIWAIGGNVSGFGLCVSASRRCLTGQQGYNLQIFAFCLTQAIDYAIAGSADGVLTGSLGQAHGGASSVFASDGSVVWCASCKISGGRYGVYARQGALIRIEGHVTPGRSYVNAFTNGVFVLGLGPFGSTRVEISETTDLRNPDVNLNAGGQLLGPTAAPLTGATPGVITRFGGWTPTIYDTPGWAAEPVVTHYVHQLSGDDAAGDGTRLNPYRSIRQAIRAAPNLAALAVALMTDYDCAASNEAEASLTRPFSFIRIMGVSGSGAPYTRKLTLANFLFPSGTTYGAGFLTAPREHGRLAVHFEDLEISFPAPPGGAYVTRGYQDGLIARTNANLGPTELFVSLRSCTIARAAGATGVVVATPYGLRSLWVDAVASPPEQAGRWVQNITAGTAPNGNTIASNLATL